MLVSKPNPKKEIRLSKLRILNPLPLSCRISIVSESIYPWLDCLLSLDVDDQVLDGPAILTKSPKILALINSPHPDLDPLSALYGARFLEPYTSHQSIYPNNKERYE